MPCDKRATWDKAIQRVDVYYTIIITICYPALRGFGLVNENWDSHVCTILTLSNYPNESWKRLINSPSNQPATKMFWPQKVDGTGAHS